MSKNTEKVSVIGLGKLGACYAAFYASKGHSVIGLDVNENNVKKINLGEAPVIEPGLPELIKENKSRLSATTNQKDVIEKSNITFIIVPTESKKNGLFSLDYIVSAAKSVGPYLKKKKGYHIFVLVSTVLPGDSRKYIIPAFEKYSGKKCGKDFGYVYSPSLIAIGDIIKNLENPDFLFLGAFDEKCRQATRDIYKNVYSGKPVEDMSVESAELAKISLNSYVTMKITFANVLGEICSKLPHADVDEVTNALGKDARIGSRYLRSGLGYGGPCFPRDNFAFAGMAKKLGIKTPLAIITHTLNNDVWKKTLKSITRAVTGTKPAITILGVAYKPNTVMSEESQALFITQALLKQKRKVILFEPQSYAEAKGIFKDKVIYSKNLGEAVGKGDVIFISNPDKIFSSLPLLLAKTKINKTVIDPWGMFKKEDFGPKVTYIALGRK